MTVELARMLLHSMHAYYSDSPTHRRSHIGQRVANRPQRGRVVDVRPALKRQ